MNGRFGKWCTNILAGGEYLLILSELSKDKENLLLEKSAKTAYREKSHM